MAGDYGEIVTALYLASRAYPAEVLEPKMWRLKSRRTKASERYDVVQLRLPHWPTASDEEAITCAEVKTVGPAPEPFPSDRRSRPSCCAGYGRTAGGDGTALTSAQSSPSAR
jgi:hypothetical protein